MQELSCIRIFRGRQLNSSHGRPNAMTSGECNPRTHQSSRSSESRNCRLLPKGMSRGIRRGTQIVNSTHSPGFQTPTEAHITRAQVGNLPYVGIHCPVNSAVCEHGAARTVGTLTKPGELKTCKLGSIIRTSYYLLESGYCCGRLRSRFKSRVPLLKNFKA